MPLHFIQIVELGLRWRHPLELHVQLMDAAFDFLGLVVEQPKLGNVTGWVFARVIVTQFSCQVESTKSVLCCRLKWINTLAVLTLHNVSTQFGSQFKRYRQSALEDVLLDLQIELVPVRVRHRATTHEDNNTVNHPPKKSALPTRTNDRRSGGLSRFMFDRHRTGGTYLVISSTSLHGSQA